MARDRNGRDHKASGRPDGGQYEGKAGQGSDDDLVEVPTTADSVAPDEGWWASLENDPEAAAGPEASREPAAKTGGDVESEDRPWWIVPGDDAPEVRKVGRIIVNAPQSGGGQGPSDGGIRGFPVRGHPLPAVRV